jgi:O-acetylhomoserine (thiol)-lyase
MLSFGIKSGRNAGSQFINALQMILLLVNIGDTKSLAGTLPSPSTTSDHQQDSLQQVFQKSWYVFLWI